MISEDFSIDHAAGSRIAGKPEVILKSRRQRLPKLRHNSGQVKVGGCIPNALSAGNVFNGGLLLLAGGPEQSELEEPCSQTSVQPSECVGSQKRHKQEARPENEGVLVFAKAEAADTTDEQIAECEIEQAP
jgi:hypothetical protein